METQSAADPEIIQVGDGIKIFPTLNNVVFDRTVHYYPIKKKNLKK